MDVTKPHRVTWFGDIHSPKSYKRIGCRWAFISQTPEVAGAGAGSSSTKYTDAPLRMQLAGPNAERSLLQGAKKQIKEWHIKLVSLRIGNGNYNLYFGFVRFWAVFLPNLAPRPGPTGRVLKMVQNAPEISPETNSKTVS